MAFNTIFHISDPKSSTARVVSPKRRALLTNTHSWMLSDERVHSGRTWQTPCEQLWPSGSIYPGLNSITGTVYKRVKITWQVLRCILGWELIVSLIFSTALFPAGNDLRLCLESSLCLLTCLLANVGSMSSQSFEREHKIGGILYWQSYMPV